MIARVRKISYHIEIHGDSKDYPILVLLHGFMGSGMTFNHLVDKLHPPADPVTIDLLGHGKSGGADSSERYSWQDQVLDLNQVLKNIGNRDIYLYGYSMGGRLALRYALNYPDSIRGLILESTQPGIEQAAAREERIQADEKRAQAIQKNFSSFLRDWNSLELFGRSERVPADREASYKRIQENQDPRQMALSLRGFGSGQMPSVKDELPGLTVPTLLVAGKKDAKYCQIMEEMNRVMPGSRFARIDGASHRVHLDRPEALVSQVASFIS